MQSSMSNVNSDVSDPESCLRVLLVEDNCAEALRLQRMTKAADNRRCDVVSVRNLEAALAQLRDTRFNLVLLDLSLPDSKGLDTLTRVQRANPNAPVVVLTGVDDNRLGPRAVRAGAEDFLVKGSITPDGLLRSISYSVERFRLLSAARATSLTDELTGLYNRRGLTTVTAPMFKSARRQKKEMILLLVDVEGMKRINEVLGPANGDVVLTEMAQLLRATYRDSDVLARLDGDKFVVLAGETDVSVAEVLVARLQNQLEARRARDSGCIPVAVNLGLSFYDPQRPCDLDELINLADSHMHEHKWRKRSSARCPEPEMAGGVLAERSRR